VRVIVIRLVINCGELVETALKKVGVGKGVGGWVKRYEGCWVLWSWCVFGCISYVVEGISVSDCRGWGCVQLVG
jgi:hypothetical protein